MQLAKYEEFLELLDQFEVAAHINWDQHPAILQEALAERSRLKYALADLYSDALDD